MRLIVAFLTLVRWRNLFFLALTQSLFQFAIFEPLYAGAVPAGDLTRFLLLVLASLFIAAGGYVINDYFDINIDEVNRPGRMVVDKLIRRRWAIAWHFMLSGGGIVLTALALPIGSHGFLWLANTGCVVLLWLYSTRFKKSLLTGNIVISLLTAWSILIIFLSKRDLATTFDPVHVRFFRLALLYAGFAFIISLIREAIKDMEDLPGDARYGCRTMPVVWGINATKVYVGVWIVVLMAVLLVLQAYVLQFGWWWSVGYCLLSLVLPLGILLAGLRKSHTPAAFHRLSSLTKWIMLAGILSMLFFAFYLP